MEEPDSPHINMMRKSQFNSTLGNSNVDEAHEMMNNTLGSMKSPKFFNINEDRMKENDRILPLNHYLSISNERLSTSITANQLKEKSMNLPSNYQSHEYVINLNNSTVRKLEFQDESYTKDEHNDTFNVNR